MVSDTLNRLDGGRLVKAPLTGWDPRLSMSVMTWPLLGAKYAWETISRAGRSSVTVPSTINPDQPLGSCRHDNRLAGPSASELMRKRAETPPRPGASTPPTAETGPRRPDPASDP